jgi:hypothetical protein
MIRVWKVWDKDCPICAEMSKFDRAEIHGKSGYYREILLSDVPKDKRLTQYLKDEVVTDDGTIDIPIYVVEWRDLIVGYIQGHKERREFRNELIQIIAKRKTA